MPSPHRPCTAPERNKTGTERAESAARLGYPPDSLGRHLPRSLNAAEREAWKRRGWCRDGVLVVSADDPRLDWPERALVARLGDRLYGARHRNPEREGRT